MRLPEIRASRRSPLTFTFPLPLTPFTEPQPFYLNTDVPRFIIIYQDAKYILEHLFSRMRLAIIRFSLKKLQKLTFPNPKP